MYEEDLPKSQAYLATKTVDDAQLANEVSLGTVKEHAPAISSYPLRYAFCFAWVRQVSKSMQMQ